jgi:hypothetical protein
MLSGNELYIVMKLTSGEQVLAVLQEEDEEHVMLEYPMVMKTIVNFEAGKEHITASPLCAYTDEQSFVILKSNILFIKKLHQVFIPHYQRIVADHQESTLFSPADSISDDSLLWGDEPEVKLETSEEEIDWNEKLEKLVPGNDTQH